MKRRPTVAAMIAVGCGVLLVWLAVNGRLTNRLAADEKKPQAPASAYKLDRTVLPIHEPKLAPITELDARNAKLQARFEVKAPKG